MDFFRYLDNLHDVSALSLDMSLHAYVPMDREALKRATYDHLKSQAGGGGGGQKQGGGQQQQQQKGQQQRR